MRRPYIALTPRSYEVFKLGLVEERFHGLHEKFLADIEIMKTAYDSNEPMKVLQEANPSIMEGFSDFDQLCLLRGLRPDRLIPAVVVYVSAKLGEEFVNPPPFDLEGSFADSNNAAPLLFVLSPGSDPMAAMSKFALEMGKEIAAISLGQGQGPKAEKLMTEAQVSGGWVLLQNCHLATSWMPKLDRILDQQDTPQEFFLFFSPPHHARGKLPRRESIGVACRICGELCGRVAIGSVDWDGGKIYMRDDDRGVCGGDIMGL